MNREEAHAQNIRRYGSELKAAETAYAVAEATEKQTLAILMFRAENEHGCKSGVAQSAWAERQQEMFDARVLRATAKGELAAAKANLLAAEVAFKQWQTEQAALRLEQRVYKV